MINLNEMELVHYGSATLDKSRIDGISNNRQRNKPSKGGLWTSPKESEFNWNDFIENEDCSDLWLSDMSSYIELNHTGLTYLINGDRDIKELVDNGFIIKTGTGFIYDYEALALKVDSIWLSYQGLRTVGIFSFDKPNFYGWDCETVLILNSKSISIS